MIYGVACVGRVFVSQTQCIECVRRAMPSAIEQATIRFHKPGEQKYIEIQLFE